MTFRVHTDVPYFLKFCELVLYQVNSEQNKKGNFMQLVTLEEIKPHIRKSIAAVLADPALFAAIEAECAKIIRDRTGMTLPETPNDRSSSADWVILPMAWLMQAIAANQVISQNEKFEDYVRNQYNDAMKIIDKHAFQAKTATTISARCGYIEGMYE